jgi:hypothetical protein
VVLVVQLGLIVQFILNPEQHRVFQLVYIYIYKKKERKRTKHTSLMDRHDILVTELTFLRIMHQIRLTITTQYFT